MWNIFNQCGLIFRASRLQFPSLSLSTVFIKKLTLFFLLFFSTFSYSQIDTITGIGYAKLTGDPFNVALLARNRAISNAISQSKIKVTSSMILEKDENGSILKEFMMSESNALIENWEVIESKVLKSGFIRSVVKVSIKNPQEEIEKEKIIVIKDLIKKSRNSSLEIKIKELVNAYFLIKKYRIYKNDLNEEIIIKEIETTLNKIKITKSDNGFDEKEYCVLEDGKINNKINIRKIAEVETIYVTVDFGVLNYKLMKMGLNIPYVKDNV